MCITGFRYSCVTGLGPGMEPSLVNKPPPPAPLPLPTKAPTPPPIPTAPPPPPVVPYKPVPPISPAREPMLVLPGNDIDMATFSPKFVHRSRTTVPPSFHISNTTGSYYRGYDVYYTNDNLTYFDDLVEGDYQYEEAASDKWGM